MALLTWFSKKYKTIWVILSALALAGAFPPWNLWPLAFLALVPLLIFTSDLSPKKSWIMGFWFGVTQGLAQMYWLNVVITQYGGLPWVLSIPLFCLMACYLALYPAFFAAIVSRLKMFRIAPFFSACFVWMGLEWVRGHILTGFPWLPLGNALSANTPLIQTAEIWGALGVSGLIVLINALLACFFEQIKNKRLMGFSTLACFLGVVILIGGGYYWGKARIEKVEAASLKADHLTVSVIQGNAAIKDIQNPAKRMQVIKSHVDLTKKAAQKITQRPWLVVWSESAGPFYYLSDARPTIAVLRAAYDLKAYICLGTMGSVKRNGSYQTTNRSGLANPKGEPHGWYDKVHLVPFGEYVPLGNILFFVRAIAALQHDFAPGEKGTILKVGKANIGPLICYESIFSDLARSQRLKGADLIINQTNDAWFGKTGASAQHMSHLIMRCVENRMACARSANSGISGFISPTGKVLTKTELFVKAYETKSLPLLKMKTVFTGYGDYLGPFGLIFILVLWPFAWFRTKGQKEE